MSLYSVPIPAGLVQPLRTPLLAVAIPLVWGTFCGIPILKVVTQPWYKALYGPPGKPNSVLSKVVKIIMRPLFFSCYASYLAIRAHDASSSPFTRDLAYKGLRLYWAQLALNVAWPGLLYLKRPLLASLAIVPLIGLAVGMTIELHQVTDGATTWYLAPYCTWLMYATYLYAGVWWLNRDRSDLDKLK